MACWVQPEEEQVPTFYENITQPHVASFDFFLSEGMRTVVDLLQPIEIEHSLTKQVYRFWFESPVVAKPIREDAPAGKEQRLFPRDCREAGTSYKGPLSIDLCWRADGAGAPPMRLTKRLGSLPIMTRSLACHLRGLSRKGLVAAREEGIEPGGYFICNGIERIIRILIMQRRHYIMALRRSAYHKRGSNYTDLATLLRCVRPDMSSATVRCHYLVDGTVNFAFTMRRSEYFIPAGILLKCFLEVSDKELYAKLMSGAAPGSSHAAFVAERAELLLHQAGRHGLRTRAQCLEHLGSHFRVVLEPPAGSTDYEVGLLLLQDYVFIHLQQAPDKLLLLLAMLHKLYALADSACCEDNPDALTHHELLLPGHLLTKVFKEKLEDCLVALKEQVKRDMDKGAEAVDLGDEAYVRKVAERMPDVGKKMEYLLTTGNLISKSGLDLSQASGFTVVAERLNFFRYISHYRGVHRGAYFAELRTTTVRKLLPESWGFMCPVHTPDGSPCGLLNHLTAACRVVTADAESPADVEAQLGQVLAELGMLPAAPAYAPPPLPAYLPIQLDGKVLGYVQAGLAPRLVARLRDIKAAVLAVEEGGGEDVAAAEALADLAGPQGGVPSHLEVVYIPPQQGGTYPGLFLFTASSRMARPVRNLGNGLLELLGTLEQCNMAIRCPDGEAGGSAGLPFSHAELSAGAMLSIVASMTPYSDYNQSPRNMYQCQMAKQTMGTPVQSWPHRTDTKLYRIQNPQTPIARTSKYEHYRMDEYPNGANMVVAVLAYTGYDMEDAMILNKSAVDRGLAHASLYKTDMVDLKEEKSARRVFAAEPLAPAQAQAAKKAGRPKGAFGQQYPQNIGSAATSQAVAALGVVPEGSHRDSDHLGADGLPHVGAVLYGGQSVYSTKDQVTGTYHPSKLKGEEVAYIEQVALIGSGKDKHHLVQRANIKMRINRNPCIGDKFASRHGQKGVLSVLWPDADMPFCAATGMRPDLIINPHAFPSRMTIGMLLESLVAKAGALEGQFVDASPFQRAEGGAGGMGPGSQVEVMGAALERRGFAKRGQETLISGVTGQEMPVNIYMGLVYYQRLRHMVSDKFQVRSTGPVNNLTRQPIKGRKFGGGIRLGEMERDALLAHGAAYTLHDRLHTCSDYHVLDVCTACGSILAPFNRPAPASEVELHGLMMSQAGRGGASKVVCPHCDFSSKHIERVAMPYVFKYLATELAAMNIKVSVEVKR